MNDDPYAERPSALASLDDLDVGPAPVRDIVDAGHKIKRRRRATLAGIAAATVLLVGGGLVTTQVLGSDQADDSLVADRGAEGDTTADGRERAVDVTLVDSQGFFEKGAATWVAESRTLTYISRLGFSSACQPAVSSTEGEDGVTLDLNVSVAAADGEEVGCSADDRVMFAAISGLDGPPAELVVTEDGVTRTVAVTNPGADGAVLTATPSKLVPGAEFVVDTTGERGPGFTLTGADGTTYYLTVQDLGGTPSWARQPGLISARALFGPGVAIVPPVALPGAYELCTANMAKQLCAEIKVEEAVSDIVTVPDVIGLPVPGAQRILEEAGFTVVVQDRECPNTDVCLGGVLRTTPAPNAEVGEGDQVVIESFR